VAFWYASLFPLGDHASEPEYPEISYNFRHWLPSAFISQSSELLNLSLLSKNAIFVPSGETVPPSDTSVSFRGAPPRMERFHRLGVCRQTHFFCRNGPSRAMAETPSDRETRPDEYQCPQNPSGNMFRLGRRSYFGFSARRQRPGHRRHKTIPTPRQRLYKSGI